MIETFELTDEMIGHDIQRALAHSDDPAAIANLLISLWWSTTGLDADLVRYMTALIVAVRSRES